MIKTNATRAHGNSHPQLAPMKPSSNPSATNLSPIKDFQQPHKQSADQGRGFSPYLVPA
ncbi:hypothetical protein [Stenotrophomonas sp. CFBP 13718]|uniref:hypothetical protein n=1 Tax=Stenotrophomonas sp. CFBP 13718 TaxID=2775304 RepID=UPI00177F4528|nr:hypothetical protein [Stenotrophomonas sp. CFBP 13718]MBD8696857.1 hypothetical protein [Stenotrophomonas sp. CFBP 13718]